MHRSSAAVSARRGGLLLLALLSLGVLPAAAVPGEILGSFAAPCAAPGDLAWDGSHLWLLDPGAAKVYRLDPTGGAIESELALDVAHPRAIAWEAGRLWVSGDADQDFVRVDLARGQIDRAWPPPRLGGGGDPVQRGGLAWADGALWSGQIAGWSSRIQQLDPLTGRVVRWFFSTGYPLAVETDGRRLWTATPTAGEGLGRILEQELATEAQRTHFDAPGRHTAGLAFDGRDLWCVDSELGRIFRLAVQ